MAGMGTQQEWGLSVSTVLWATLPDHKRFLKTLSPTDRSLAIHGTHLALTVYVATTLLSQALSSHFTNTPACLPLPPPSYTCSLLSLPSEPIWLGSKSKEGKG